MHRRRTEPYSNTSAHLKGHTWAKKHWRNQTFLQVKQIPQECSNQTNDATIGQINVEKIDIPYSNKMIKADMNFHFSVHLSWYNSPCQTVEPVATRGAVCHNAF